MYEILNHLDIERNLENILKIFDDEEQEIFHSYIDFLLEKEFIFLDNSLHNRFPPIDINKFSTPNIISNAIIEYNGGYDFSAMEMIINQLDHLRCESVEMRFYDFPTADTVDRLLLLFNETGIRSITLTANYQEFMTDFYFEELSNKHKRIREVGLFSGNKRIDIKCRLFPIYFLEGEKVSEKYCGCISPKIFYVNIKNFTESRQYNSCLNKKISINVNGEIKNCPSMKSDFGNIFNTSLANVCASDSFKSLWNISKDEISICKDCEFRYICTDCRAYTVDSDDELSKPSKCNYNPYISEWV
jgi:SPASM domain peptide maturase of grasp-with-spasm system